jgi:hypothetical protein
MMKMPEEIIFISPEIREILKNNIREWITPIINDVVDDVMYENDCVTAYARMFLEDKRAEMLYEKYLMEETMHYENMLVSYISDTLG